MHEELVTSYMPGSVAEMDAYFATLETVVTGWEDAKASLLTDTCSSSNAGAIWGTDATDIAMCIDYSTCNSHMNQVQDPNTGAMSSTCDALRPISGFHDTPCANCTDSPTQAGCACYRPMQCTPPCTPGWVMLGEVWDESSGAMVRQTYNASTDVCTMNNRTDPNDPNGELETDSGPREGKCAQRYGANSNDGSHEEGHPVIAYRLFAQAAMTAESARPFVTSNMAINAFNRCDNQTDSWEGRWDVPAAPWPGAQCGTITLGDGLEDLVLDGSVNEGTMVLAPALHPGRRMGLIVNAINRVSALSLSCAPSEWTGFRGEECGACGALVLVRDNGGTCAAFCTRQGLGCVDAWDDTTNGQCSNDAPSLGCGHQWAGTSDGICQCASSGNGPSLNATGGVVAIHGAVNAGGRISATDMIKATIFNATNQAGGTLTTSGSAVMKTVTNGAGGTLQFLSGSAAIMDASNAGTMSITGLVSGFLADVHNLAGGVMTVQGASTSQSTVKIQGANNAGVLTASDVAVEGCTIANSGAMAITGSVNVALSLTANTGSIDFTGSTGTVTMVNGAERGTVTNAEGITWVDNGADCTITGSDALTASPTSQPTPAPSPSPTEYVEPCTPYGWQDCAVDADCTLQIGGTGHMGSQRTGYGSYTCKVPDIPGCTELRCVPIPATAFVCAVEADCIQGDVCVDGLCVACAADPTYSRGACNFTVGVSIYHDGPPRNGAGGPGGQRSGCAGDHCMHECAYDTHCVQVLANTTVMDLNSVHNTLGMVVLDDETREDMIRPGSCGGTGDFGMRCSGEIVRAVGNKERTPDAVRARDANVVEFTTPTGWTSEFQVSDADRAASLESWNDKGQPCAPDCVLHNQPMGEDEVAVLHVGAVVPASVFEAEDTAITVFSAYNFRLNRMAECQVKWSTTEPLHPDPTDPQWGATTDPVPTRSTLMVRGCVRWGDYHHASTGYSEVLWNDTRTDPPTPQWFSGFSEGDCNSWVLAGSQIPHSVGSCSVAGPNVQGLRHHFGPHPTSFPALHRPSRAV